MRLTTSSLASFVVCLAIGLSGCQQLFTTSLGASLARTSISIPSNLTADQAAALAAQAKANQDPVLAAALVSSLLTEIGTTTDPTTKAALESSAASAAIIASGVGSTLTSILSSGNVSTDPATLASLVATVQAGASPSVVTALSFLSNPTVMASSGLSATDLLAAAVVVGASALPSGDPSSLSPSQLATFQGTQQFATASAILASATTLAGSDPAVTGILTGISGAFSL